MWLTLGSATRELRDGEVVVGSGADADWRVPTADLMPRHFTITVHGLNASLKPASKDNVVVMNGRQMSTVPYLLNDGDVIAAGGGRFVFSDETPRTEPATPPEPAVPPRAAFLVDEKANVAHPLLGRSTTIGRDSSNTIVLADSVASRFHAEIRREAGGYALHTMGSSGTTLNSQRLDVPAMLGDDDTIEIAYTRLRFTRTEPAGVPIAGVHDLSSEKGRRNPTLATGKLSIVPRSAAGSTARIVVGAVLIALIVLAFLLSS